MRTGSIPSKWHQTSAKKGSHWGILALDDRPNIHEKSNPLTRQLKAPIPAVQELSDEKSKKSLDDYSI